MESHQISIHHLSSLLPTLQVTLLNFMITPLGLEDQLLGIVAAKEKPELEEKKNQLIIESAANKKQVRRIWLSLLSRSAENEE